jgi:Fe-S-cluster containining protein
MRNAQRIDAQDNELVQIVDAAVAEAARRSGAWLVCRLGCTQCCIGPFPINPLDARRLRRGLTELAVRDPPRAGRVKQRARESVARLSPAFPGDLITGLLFETQEAQERFSSFADDEACPALDPETGACDLYAARPITCRTFGPPVRFGSDSVGVCELCYEGASDAEIAACEVEIEPGDLEAELLEGLHGETIVAFCLVDEH